MKYLVAIVLVCYAASVLGLSDEMKAEIKKARDECIKSTKVPKDLVEDACKKGEFAEDEKLKEYSLCFWKKWDMINDAGDYQTEAMKKHMVPELGEEVVDKVIAKCTKETHGSGSESAFQFSKCFYELVKKEHKVKE